MQKSLDFGRAKPVDRKTSHLGDDLGVSRITRAREDAAVAVRKDAVAQEVEPLDAGGTRGRRRVGEPSCVEKEERHSPSHVRRGPLDGQPFDPTYVTHRLFVA